jgi:glycosyltransferase involved in cell wall biosynthesis
LLLVGDGPQRAACEALASELHLDANVRFLGHRSDVPQLLAVSDLLVMPSESEGLGLAAIEALAAGKPVIAFAVGGLPEVVADRANGRLVTPGDCSGFSTAVVETIRDRQQLADYGWRAALASRRFTVAEHVRKLIDCYHEALSGLSN